MYTCIPACITAYDSRLRRANYKCVIAVRRIGTERDHVYSIIIACCGGIDIVSLTGFAACVELAECRRVHPWVTGQAHIALQ
jgi:hypothetical protein